MPGETPASSQALRGRTYHLTAHACSSISQPRWYWGSKLLIICICDGTVTGFCLANPKLYGEREQARQMLQHQPAIRPVPWHRRRHR
jgi:hypothetical protein